MRIERWRTERVCMHRYVCVVCVYVSVGRVLDKVACVCVCACCGRVLCVFLCVLSEGKKEKERERGKREKERARVWWACFEVRCGASSGTHVCDFCKFIYVRLFGMWIHLEEEKRETEKRKKFSMR